MTALRSRIARNPHVLMSTPSLRTSVAREGIPEVHLCNVLRLLTHFSSTRVLAKGQEKDTEDEGFASAWDTYIENAKWGVREWTDDCRRSTLTYVLCRRVVEQTGTIKETSQVHGTNVKINCEPPPPSNETQKSWKQNFDSALHQGICRWPSSLPTAARCSALPSAQTSSKRQ